MELRMLYNVVADALAGHVLLDTRCAEVRLARHPIPYNLHPTPYTLPYTLHPTPYTLNLKP